jgi:DNA-binding XRE family transcriptional regulator
MQYMENDLIDRLETFRLENKITLQELAKSLDVNYTTLYRWFSEKNNPNKIQQYQITKLLDKKL